MALILFCTWWLEVGSSPLIGHLQMVTHYSTNRPVSPGSNLGCGVLSNRRISDTGGLGFE